MYSLPTYSLVNPRRRFVVPNENYPFHTYDRCLNLLPLLKYRIGKRGWTLSQLVELLVRENDGLGSAAPYDTEFHQREIETGRVETDRHVFGLVCI